LYEWITEFNAATDVPMVISVSYAWWEGDQCNPGISGDACSQMGVDSYGYAIRVNTEFMKSGARGVSILVASGDSGTNGRTDPDCSIPKLRPDFPACSPYVTSVGATELVNAQALQPAPAICSNFGGCAKSGTEQAVSYRISSYASGGGFSNTGGMPSYQKTAVANYLKSGVTLPPASYFNTSGRAFPDIAALGHQCVVVQNGYPEGVGGTSCAAPIVGGLFSLLNQYSFKKSGKPLGFLNPLIYQMFTAQPNIFQDITVGDNKCTEDGCSSGCKGFLAAKGWDPVTGVGTPNYQQILKYLQTHVFNKK
jgi:tripeptidyl-peptidase-1